VGIIAIIQEALRIGRTHKSLWLFGFLVGFSPNFSYDVGGGQQETPAAVGTVPELGTWLPVGLLAVAAIVAFVILKFVSTGALIEGVKRARSHGSMTMREGFREGWAHWGVLFRIALLYAGASFVSVAVLAGACYLVWLAFGSPAVFFAGGLAIVVGAPWLVTLYMWQAFAERIAVLENRRALDAIHKARLFLHGRLHLGLRLFAAGFVGVLFVGAVSLVTLVVVALLLRGSAALGGMFVAVPVGVLTLLPLLFIAVAMVGIITSSVWTIGYLTQVER
jgi:hypothetical protein